MTNAWLQRIIVLGSLLFWVMLAAWLWPTQKGWAWLCLTAPLLITPVMLGIQCMWAALCNRSGITPPASLGQWLHAWLSEWKAATLVFCGWQPFRHNTIANNIQPTPGLRGMVLVHGFFCNRALWTAWMRLLQARGRVFVSVDLEPAYGTISNYAQTIETAVRQVEQATGLPPVIVGHSMGGLAIRAWAAKFIGSEGNMARVQRIITLGTPHHGTAIAAMSYTSNGHEMRQSSEWLANNTLHLPRNFSLHCTCFFSHCDNIVFPANTATLPNADNRHIAGHAHVQLVFSNEIQQACLGHLEN